MADQVYEIDIQDKATPKLRGLQGLIESIASDMGKAAGSLGRMESKLDDTAKAADEAAKGTRGFRASIIALDSAFGIVQKSASLARQAFSLFKEPVTFAVDVESGINALRTLSDGITPQLRQQLLALPAEIGQTTQQTLKSAYDALSAGISENKLIDTLREAGKLARAGQGDLTDTLSVLRTSLKAYESSGVDANTVSDVLFATIRKGVTTLPELASSFGQVVGVAGQYGISIQETGAAIAELTKIAPSTSIAVTQLNSLISELASPSEQAKRKLGALRVEYGITALQAKGLTGVLADLQRATGGNVAILGGLFQRQEATRALLTLLADGQKGYRDSLDATTSAAGETNRANRIMSEGLRGTLNRLNALKEQALNEIGNRLLPRVADGLERLLTYFRGEGIAQIDRFGDALITLGKGFLFVANTATKVIGAIESVGEYLGESAAKDYLRIENGLAAIGREIDAVGKNYDTFVNNLSGGAIAALEAYEAQQAAAADLASQNSILAKSASEVANAFISLALDEYDQQLETVALGMQGASSASIALEASVSAASSAFGLAAPAVNAAGGALARLPGVAFAVSDAFIATARSVVVSNAALTGIPGAAIAASAALDGVLAKLELAKRRSVGGAAIAALKPQDKVKPGGETAAQAEEKRQREALELARRVDTLIERARVERERREENIRRLNEDARIQAIADEGERTVAALELQFARERETYAKAGADLQLLEASQAQRRLEAQRQAADVRLQAQQAEYAASATIANNLAGLTDTLAQGSRKSAGFVALFKGIALGANALSAAVESKIEFARGNILQGLALASASALGFAQAANLKSQGRSLGANGGAGGASSAPGGGGGAAPTPRAPGPSRSDFGGGGTQTTVLNVGTLVSGPGGLRELARQTGPRSDRYVNGHNGYIGERP